MYFYANKSGRRIEPARFLPVQYDWLCRASPTHYVTNQHGVPHQYVTIFAESKRHPKLCQSIPSQSDKPVWTNPHSFKPGRHFGAIPYQHRTSLSKDPGALRANPVHIIPRRQTTLTRHIIKGTSPASPYLTLPERQTVSVPFVLTLTKATDPNKSAFASTNQSGLPIWPISIRYITNQNDILCCYRPLPTKATHRAIPDLILPGRLYRPYPSCLDQCDILKHAKLISPQPKRHAITLLAESYHSKPLRHANSIHSISSLFHIAEQTAVTDLPNMTQYQPQRWTYWPRPSRSKTILTYATARFNLFQPAATSRTKPGRPNATPPIRTVQTNATNQATPSYAQTYHAGCAENCITNTRGKSCYRSDSSL